MQTLLWIWIGSRACMCVSVNKFAWSGLRSTHMQQQQQASSVYIYKEDVLSVPVYIRKSCVLMMKNIFIWSEIIMMIWKASSAKKLTRIERANDSARWIIVEHMRKRNGNKKTSSSNVCTLGCCVPLNATKKSPISLSRLQSVFLRSIVYCTLMILYCRREQVVLDTWENFGDPLMLTTLLS